MSAVLGTPIHKLMESNAFSSAHSAECFNALQVHHLMHKGGGTIKRFYSCVACGSVETFDLCIATVILHSFPAVTQFLL